MQDGPSPSPTFLSPFLHAVSVFFLGNKSLVLQSRQCLELNILTPSHPPSLPSLIFAHWVYFQTLGALCFLFKRGYSSQRGPWGMRGCNLEFQARPAFLPLSGHTLSCSFGDDV